MSEPQEPQKSQESPTCWTSHLQVYFDDLDLNGHVHNARLVALVERAQTELFAALGPDQPNPLEREPDLRYVVRELHVEFLAPIDATGSLEVALTADRLGVTSATYGFRCFRPGAETTLVSGYRSVVKVGLDGRPQPWSPWYREVFASLSTGALPPKDGPPKDGLRKDEPR